MQSHTIEPFSNNWAYLKAELTWLDRVLGMAIARQRQETKVVDRVARSRVDRVTSHWWRGLVTLEGEAAYDSPVENPRQRSTIPKASYQQQLEAKIKVSQQSGIVLGLPLLCSRLQLGTAEKNLLLMALAPEISRRYARLYNYLQETEHPGATGLPTVDLILRLLCRTDADWRSLRQSLTEDSALIKHQLLDLRSSHAHPLLARPVKLPDPLVNYLLADQPESHALETLLQPSPCSAPASPLSSLLASSPFPSPTQNLWSALILPPALLADLQHLCHRVQFAQQVDEDWGFAAGLQLGDRVGTIALLVGVAGTGKTLAARAIAQTLKTPLLFVDLAQLHQDDVPSLLQAIATQAPPVLLLKSAECWFGRMSALPNTVLHQFLALRRQQQSITLLSVHQKHSLAAQWRRELHPLLAFPMPTQAERLKLWQQAFPEVVPLAEIDWEQLARLPLSGGDIYTIARDAAIDAAASDTKLTTQHLIQAYERVKGQTRGRKF